MKWAETLVKIVAMISMILILAMCAAAFIMALIGLVNMTINLIIPWFRGTL